MNTAAATKGAATAANAPASTDALFSANWYRVAALSPRLRGHVRIHRHVYRGEVWYVVQDRSAGRYHRFNPRSYRVIGQLDGKRTLQRVWEQLSSAPEEDTPTQDELVQLFGQLHAADLIQCDVTPDVAELFERGDKQRRSHWLARFANPVSLRFPLLDPDRLLARTLARAGPLGRGPGVLLWLLVVLPAVALAPLHWRELTGNFNERLLGAGNLVLMAVLFPLLKAAHEWGHGLACRRHGGEVHEMGVMLLVFFPVPYVDASSASAFPGRWARAFVGAAGMLTEIFIAALAFYLWLLLEPGFLRSLAYNVIVLASVTTVLFNANPLLRYDGYYILSDLIESPNLAQRATQYWGYLLQRHVFGARDAAPPTLAPGERGWFLAYAPLAFAYRMFVLVSIAMFIASRYFFFGVILAVWGLLASFIVPMARSLGRLAGNPALERHALRVRLVLGAAAVGAVLLLVAVPMPHHTVAEGVVQPPERAVLRAQSSGFVQRIVGRPGQPLHEGDVVLDMHDAALSARLGVQSARLAQARIKHGAAFGASPVRAALLSDEVRREEAGMASLEDDLRKLVIRAGVPGNLVLLKADDLPGRYLRRGDVVGYVDTGDTPVVRVFVPHWEAQWRAGDTGTAAPAAVAGTPAATVAGHRIEVRFPQDASAVWRATWLRSVPGADRSLPGALGTTGGGALTLDPRDPQGKKALEALFEHELGLPDAAPHRQIGTRVQVRFEHEPEPLGWRLARAMRRQFLSHFEI